MLAGATSWSERAESALWLVALVMLGAALLVLRKLRRDARVMASAEPDDGQAARVYADVVLYRRLLRQARPYWLHVAVIFVLSLLATPLALLTPVPLKIAVDSVIGDHPVPSFLQAAAPANLLDSEEAVLVFVAILLVGIYLLSELRSLSESLLSTFTSQRLQLNFRTRLFRHGQRLSLRYHDRRGTADSAYRIQYDSSSISSVVLNGITPLITSAFTLVAMILVIAKIDLELALIALAVAPFMGALTWASRRRLRRGWREAKSLESSALAVIQEVLVGLRVVKSFGQEDREETRFVDSAGASVRARMRMAALEGGFSVILGLVTTIGTALVLLVGVRHVQAGTLTLGSLLLVMAYLAQLYSPLRLITKSFASLQSSLASAERAFSLLDEPPDVPERPHPRRLERAHGDVAFRNVSFSYDHGSPVLQGISLEVSSGTRVGIAGTTGAGKTTLVSLLTRFYDPTEGEILLDGIDLRDYKVDDLRNQFGIVLQEPVLFSTTIGENIAYGRPDADFDEITEAAKAANIHDFVASLPEGYDTQVGERGMRLSGGERQRISLARAFLKDAPILILDEPTSSVDVRTEAMIIEAMERLMRGRTTFMIAHRLSTLEHCDLRLEVEDGRLVPPRPRMGPQTSTAVGSVTPALRPLGTRDVDATRRQAAVRAWRTVSAEGSVIRAVETLERKRVYRLRGAAPDGRSVIAKRRGPGAPQTERLVYETVLPQLDVPSPSYFGSAEEPDGSGWWLFVEEVLGREFGGGEDRRRAAEWLAETHERASSLDLDALPDRGAAYYLDHLRSARETIAANANRSQLQVQDRLVLRVIRLNLDVLERRWQRIEAVTSAAPRTFVHGDLALKNVRVRGSNGDAVFVPFDWGEAGAGPPAVDLTQRVGKAVSPELETYAQRIASLWPDLTPAHIRRLADVGAVFRTVAAVSWASVGLDGESPEKQTSTLAVLQPKLHQLVEEHVRARGNGARSG